MTIESKGYIATEADITLLTQSVLDGASAVTTGHTTYLRALVATTQEALGARPRVRAGKVSKLDENGVKAQLGALAAVHDRFYSVVLETASAAGHAKGLPLNRVTNFARTAMYAIRSWVKAGNDITSLAPARVSKSALMVQGKQPVRQPSLNTLRRRAVKQSKQLVVTLLQLSETDKSTAVVELQTVMGILAEQLSELGAKPLRDSRKAAAEGKPFRQGSVVFVPTATQVIGKAELAQ